MLVVCRECSLSFLTNNVAKSILRELVSFRDNTVKRAMHRTLCSPTRTYTPPGEFDPEIIFREMIESGSLDFCLNGG